MTSKTEIKIHQSDIDFIKEQIIGINDQFEKAKVEKFNPNYTDKDMFNISIGSLSQQVFSESNVKLPNNDGNRPWYSNCIDYTLSAIVKKAGAFIGAEDNKKYEYCSIGGGFGAGDIHNLSITAEFDPKRLLPFMQDYKILVPLIEEALKENLMTIHSVKNKNDVEFVRVIDITPKPVVSNDGVLPMLTKHTLLSG
jgi:hypothetical protein